MHLRSSTRRIVLGIVLLAVLLETTSRQVVLLSCFRPVPDKELGVVSGAFWVSFFYNLFLKYTGVFTARTLETNHEVVGGPGS